MEHIRQEKEIKKQEYITNSWWFHVSDEERKQISREHKKERNQKQRQRQKEKDPELYKKNKRERRKRYYENNPEKKKEERKKYKITERHRRRAIEKRLESNFTTKQWQQCKERFNNKCAYCEKHDMLTQDHFIAVSKGGEYTKNNIVPSCHSCNSDKRDLSFFEWYPMQPFYNKKREQKILRYLNYTGEYQQLAIV
jgi:hypothetical protein